MKKNHLKFKSIKRFILIFALSFPLIVQAQISGNFTSELPLIVINTNGKTIVNEPKIEANMKIIHNPGGTNKVTDTPNEYNGKVGIEIRGKSSSNYPQKPYLFETRNADGSNNNVSILGLPEENDWILLSNYNDKSLMRNVLGYQLFEKLGHYAPRARMVNVVINNEYQGIYVLTEKIKRDKNRVDIAKLKEDDNEGEELTGGYIFKIDYYTANDSWLSPYSPLYHPQYDVHFVYHDPEWDELTTQQKNYLKNYVTTFEGVLYGLSFDNPQTGYNNYIDVQSFIDYFIVSEVSRNNDGFKKSRYFHKDKNGKITAGPVWDFDWAWKNIAECYIFRATDGSGWAYKINDCNPDLKSPGWMVRLFYDTNFKNQTNCRYFEMRSNVLSNQNIFNLIDSTYNVVKNEQQKHFDKWNTLGRNVGAPEVDAQPTTYTGEIEKLKNWITTRLNWLDENMIGTCTTVNSFELANNFKIKIYPNPARDFLSVLCNENVEKIRLTDLTGKIILEQNSIHSELIKLDVSTLPAGIYLTTIQTENGKISNQKIIIQK